MPRESQVQKQQYKQENKTQEQNAQELERQRSEQQEQERIRREEELARLRTQNEFWNGSEDVNETIPQNDDLTFAKMECAYKDVHGEKMGLKQRMSRSAKQANKKRARGIAVTEERDRYYHALDYAAKKYQIDQKFPSQLNGYAASEAENFKTFYTRSFKTWLDLTNTDEGNAFNEKMMRHLSGGWKEQNKIAMEILTKFQAWDLEQYSNLNDEDISENFAVIRDKAEKAQEARSILDVMLKNGADLDAEFVADIRARCMFFEELRRVVDVKAQLMETLYYALLRKSDMAHLTDEQLRQKTLDNQFMVKRPVRSLEKGEVIRIDGEIQKQEVYNAELARYTALLGGVRRLQPTREALKNPAAFLEEAKRREKKVHEKS